MVPVRRVAAVMVSLSAILVGQPAWDQGPASMAPAAAQSPTEIIVAQDGSGDFTSIVEAISVAQDGDIIAVLPGTYEGPLDITVDITLLGRGAREDIVIAGPARDFENGEFRDQPQGIITLHGADATISGLTTRGPGQRGGDIVHIDVSSIWPEAREGSISMDAPRDAPVDPRIDVRLLREPRGQGSGQIVVIGGSPALSDLSVGSILMTVVTDALVEDNLVRDSIRADGGNASIRGNRTGSIRLDSGVGMVAEENEVGSIWVGGSSSVVRDNRVRSGGGGQVGIDVSRNSSDSTVEGNSIEGKGVGISVRGSAPVTLRGNSVTKTKVGLLLGNANSVIEGNTFCGNTRDVVFIDGVEVDLEGNEICEAATAPSVDPSWSRTRTDSCSKSSSPGCSAW